MSCTAQGLGSVRGFWRCAVLLGSLLLPLLVQAQSTDPEGEFVYHARARDTLIGLGRRLLKEPRRWPDVQSRNNIADPRHIPLGDSIRIPYSWLRLDGDLATVVAVSGAAQAAGQTISVGQTLSEGTRLQTGGDGSLTLLLADRSLVTLHKLSVLALEEMRHVVGVEGAHSTRFKLEAGRLQTQVKPHGDVGRFEIRTPVAVSAVRGTEFRDAFGAQGDSAITETLDGVVEVSGSGSAVSVPADFGTRVARGAPPQAPIRLLPAPDLQANAATNNSIRLRLQWPGIPGAAHYRLQLAPTPQFQSFLVDLELDEPQIDLPAPADGTYWLRVRAIDGSGLEGHDAARPFVQHQVPAAPSVVAPLSGASIVGEVAALSWSASDTPVHYRVQVASDSEFTRIVFDRDTGEVTHVDTDHLPSGVYFWRVSAVDSGGQSGEWSAVQQYTQRLASPTPYRPELARRELRLHWDAQEGMRYHVQLARDPQFDTLLVDESTDLPRLTTRRYKPGVYYARVQTIASDGSAAPFGQPVRFDIPIPVWWMLLPLLTLIPFV